MNTLKFLQKNHKFLLVNIKFLYNFGAIKTFILPDLGEKIKEATVKEWHVKVGEEVEEFQTLADVSTDKLFTQIPSSYSGKIHKLYYEVDDIALVGEPFLQIEVEGEEAETEAQPAPEKQIKKEEKPVQQKQQQEQQQPPKQAPAASIPKVQQSETFTTEQKKMDNFAQGMQKSMTAANEIPHLYIMEEIDITETGKFREQLKQQGHKVTFMSIFIKSFSQALHEYPIINSLYNPAKPFEYDIVDNHNITVAINSPHGLVVPNIKNVQNLNILEVQQEINQLREKAMEGKLGASELFEGTCTISNIGTIGGTYANPIIFAPQTSIMAIGRGQKLPRYIDGKLEHRNVINVSLGCDHRVIDGATATQFINRWKAYLENPSSMLLTMK